MKKNISAEDLTTSTALKLLKRHGKPNARKQLAAEFKDIQIKGLKLALISSSKAPNRIHIKLYSYAETQGNKHRNTWYSNIHDKDTPTDQDLAQIKAKANAWHTEQLNKAQYSIICPADYLTSFLTGYEKTNTKHSYTQRLNAFNEFMPLDITELKPFTIVKSLHERFPHSCNDYLSVFCKFLKFIFQKTGSSTIPAIITEINMLRPKITTTTEHYRTIESMNNQELTEKIIQGFTRLFMSNKKQEQQEQMITRFLLPLRISEVMNITPKDITADRLHIPHTKTTENFYIPLSKAAAEFITNHLITVCPKTMYRLHNKFFNISTHGIRSIFDNYFSRLNKYQFDFIEACLTHKDSNPITQAYRADARNYYYSQRIPIMYEWYDFIFDCVRQARERAKGENIQKISA